LADIIVFLLKNMPKLPLFRPGKVFDNKKMKNIKKRKEDRK